MSPADAKGFLGTGWAFPPSFSRGGQEVAMVSDETDIQQSLALLFATRRGERMMLESYGGSLEEWLYAEVDQELLSGIATRLEEAVLLHEPRVELLNLEVSLHPKEAGVLLIRVDYQIPATNSRFNMVFPFYLNEATAVSR
ncbi:MAG: GPW/gp25 family protein [Cyanobacteriota bacterium]|jgi:phage baseplate assembly protein W